MPANSSSRKPPRPLDAARLEELAVAYVGRFATTRSKLAAYLSRKVMERGWDGEADPDFEALAERLARLGYVDDAAYALAKARSLGSRGYGRRRVAMALRAAGIAEEDGGAANEASLKRAVAVALRFAQRKRIGPYAADRPDPKGRDRALSAMVRAGHDFDLARKIIDLAPGSADDPEAFSEIVTD